MTDIYSIICDYRQAFSPILDAKIQILVDTGKILSVFLLFEEDITCLVPHSFMPGFSKFHAYYLEVSCQVSEKRSYLKCTLMKGAQFVAVLLERFPYTGLAYNYRNMVMNTGKSVVASSFLRSLV